MEKAGLLLSLTSRLGTRSGIRYEARVTAKFIPLFRELLSRFFAALLVHENLRMTPFFMGLETYAHPGELKRRCLLVVK